MDLTLTPAEEAFRDELREWLNAHHPGPEPEDDAYGFEFRRKWQRELNTAGYAGLSWPHEYGGRGATLIEQAIFNEELTRADAPQPANVLGLVMGGPVVIHHGTPEQKERYLAPILSAEEIWCQGFSEPDSGSDLASLKTRAVRDGDDWVVNGQKVWTTLAHTAKWCMLLARTDPTVPKHKGLTYFLMDMEQDGVQVRPLRQITGESEFNELFLEDVRIPNENIVGGEGNGWNVALCRERGATKDPLVRQRLAQLHIETENLRLNALRGLTAQMRTGVPGPEGSLPKWQWSDTNQALTELALDVLGDDGLRVGDQWTYRFLRARANSIEGGTTEILKNIIAERVLGLPRAARPSADPPRPTTVPEPEPTGAGR